MKRGFGTYTIYHGSVSKRTYHVDLWEQPLRRWLVAQIYHWYDMHIYKVPGFKLLERFLQSRHRGNPMLYIPLSAEQDCKCYFLMKKDKTVLASFEVTEELRERLYRGDSYYV